MTPSFYEVLVRPEARGKVRVILQGANCFDYCDVSPSNWLERRRGITFEQKVAAVVERYERAIAVATGRHLNSNATLPRSASTSRRRGSDDD